MGILDVFKKKKEEDSGMFGQPAFTPQQPSYQDQQYQDQGFNSSPDMFGQQGGQGFGQQMPGQEQSFGSAASSQNPTSPQFSPEAAGFDKVRERDAYPSRGNQSVAEINLGKDMEIISAKLDAIKAELDSMNQRLKRMERISEGAGSQKHDQWY